MSPSPETENQVLIEHLVAVGMPGLEPGAFRPPDGRATKLRHIPLIVRSHNDLDTVAQPEKLASHRPRASGDLAFLVSPALSP